MLLTPRALTLDLDDTLWPIAPVIAHAELALDAWLRARHPCVAERWPIPAMRVLRERVAAEHPQLAHDFSAQRRLALARAFVEAGADAAHAEAAFEVYFAARHRVALFPEVDAALPRLAARAPLAGLSNGNAELARLGLMQHFEFQLGAREHGVGKPDPSIFLAACARLARAPHEVLHVGDDPALDVLGAARAGLRTAWINRHGAPWPHPDVRPDLEFPDLAVLADWLDAQQQRSGVAA